LVSIFGCFNSKDLYSLNFTVLDWDELEADLKTEFLEGKQRIFDLDSQIEIAKNHTGIEGITKGKLEFQINEESYFLKWNSNKEVFPFLIKNNFLYLLYDEKGGGPMFRTESTLSKYQIYKFQLMD